jgi:hypothetical protein
MTAKIKTSNIVRKNPINPNLFNANMATCTNSGGNTTGFNVQGAGVTLTSSSTSPLKGGKCLKLSTQGHTNDGYYTDITTGGLAATAYTSWITLKIPEGIVFTLKLQNQAGTDIASVDYTGTGNYDSIKLSGTSPAGTTGFYGSYIFAKANHTPSDIYVGELILRKGTY